MTARQRQSILDGMVPWLCRRGSLREVNPERAAERILRERLLSPEDIRALAKEQLALLIVHFAWLARREHFGYLRRHPEVSAALMGDGAVNAKPI
jgi:hypothetical protein